MAHKSVNEIEIKLRVASAAALRRRLRALGAKTGPSVHEANVLFDTPDESLRRRGMLLRVRVERPSRRIVPSRSREARIALLDSWMFPTRTARRAVITFKGPPTSAAADFGEAGPPAVEAIANAGASSNPGRSQGEYKIRREIEFEASDALHFREILNALGLRPAFYYEKIRTSYRLPGLRQLVISLDETPAGVFLELEGRPADIDRGREKLGYRPEDAIVLSYGALYAEYRRKAGLAMTDMLFVSSRE